MSRWSPFTSFLVLLGVWMTVPYLVSAEVVISEIAWMGTITDANDEWIELHNRGTDPVDVTGWTVDDGDALFISLSGSIPANGFALLERSDDNAVTSVTAFQIYTGALSNAGKTITLRNSAALKIDTVVGGENWSSIGGNNVSKDTPQRTGGTGWVTAKGTPGISNASSGTIPDSTDTSHTSTTQSSNGSGGRVTYGVPSPPAHKPDQLTLLVQAPSVVYVNQEVNFILSATGPGKTIVNSLVYAWNFGDTFTSTKKEPAHTFLYPGEYTVVVDAAYSKQAAQVRHEITVLPVSFTLSRGSQGELLLVNHSSQETDIGGFMLEGTASSVFPKHTIIKAGGTLTIPSVRAGSGQNVVLFDATRTQVASLESPRMARAASVPQAGFSTVTQKEPVPVLNEPPVSEIPTGIIRIGADIPPSESGNMVTRFFQKFRGIFSRN